VSTWDTTRNATGNMAFSNANQRVTTSTSGVDTSAFSVNFKSTGKWICTFNIVQVSGAGNVAVGFGDSTASSAAGQYIGIDTHSVGLTTVNPPQFGVNNVFTNTGMASAIVAGHNVDLAIDLNAKLIWMRDLTNSASWFGNNGVGDPVAGTNGFSIAGLAGFTLSPAVDLQGSTPDGIVDIGVQTTSLTGYSPWQSVITYYVSATGNNSNNGTSPSTSWLDATNVNTAAYNGGDSILFHGGDTITGHINLGVANWGSSPAPSSSAPVTFGSYGTGRGTVSSGGSTGFTAYNLGGFIVRDLIFVGGSQTAAQTDGLLVWTDSAANLKHDYVQLLNLDVSLYGRFGIGFAGNNASAGFSNVTIKACVCHDGAGFAVNFSAGISMTSAGYGVGNSAPSYTNVLIDTCTVYNNTGAAGGTNWNGSGIVIAETNPGTIQFCEAYNNGANSNNAGSGPAGIWCYDCGNILIQFNESHDNLSTTIDGDGFDLDGGCVNCTLQYNYSHGNKGFGLSIYSYNDGTVTTNSGSTVRYNISQNDLSAGIQIASSGTLTGCAVYNNTVYTSAAPSILLTGSAVASITGRVANNILYATSGNKFITFTTAGDPAGLIFSGNDYYTTGTFSLTWNVSTYTTFASWIAAETEQEPIAQQLPNPLVNPSLASPGGGGTMHGYAPANLSQYQLSFASPMVGVGLDLNSLYSISPGTVDFYGNAVPNGRGTGFNVGAYGGIPLGVVSSDSIGGGEFSLTARSGNEQQRTVWWS
jgi:hypothetical protein